MESYWAPEKLASGDAPYIQYTTLDIITLMLSQDISSFSLKFLFLLLRLLLVFLLLRFIDFCQHQVVGGWSTRP